MITTFRSAGLGGIVLFLWGVISWMVLPWHNATLNGFDNQPAVEQAMRNTTAADGIYVIPNPNGPKSEEHMRKLTEGPFAFVAYSPDGV